MNPARYDLRHSIMSSLSLAPSIQVGFAALRVNPLRTALSALGVIIGVGAMVSVLSLSDGVEESVRSQLSKDGRFQSLVVSPISEDIVDGQRIPRATVTPFTPDDARELAKEVAEAGSVFMSSSGPGLVSDPAAATAISRGALVSGTLANGSERAGLTFEAGRFFSDAEVLAKAKVAVISRQLADTAIGRSVPSAALIGKPIRVQDSIFTIIGIFKAEATSGPTRNTFFRAFVPLTVAPFAMVSSAGPGGITVKSTKIEDLPIAQKGTEAWLARRYGDWKKQATISSYADESAKLRDNMVIFKILMGAITGVSLVVGGVGIMNVLLASVTERTREIGVRKATGARNRDLLAQFLAESVAIAGFGSVLGTMLGVAVSAGVAAFMRAKTMAPVHPGFSLSTLIVAIAAPIIVGIGFGIYPALRAARLSPIEAIRHE
ncbi:MAG TPA: ABC transporter permease [Gemmatimonadaceae bacterium]|nr:ABC transporter permease [Gemmatimonadaceae bacterium]